ncbi:hypothetical protein AVI53_10115 [Piscirickettsia salmonis]|nr:hypothetical protein PSLF89_03445 [Piscirickettsia salmonis LF-89 = ATCC VR-1361]ALY01480.1 hypothetical protein AWE47_00155 [Piscirickettsia salmonis]AMA40994.1 hypothetical protein AWJ11_00160 [Piscirickettsia salmonis]AOS36182.1 hypothetical protein AVM72_13150 [Piscirickettsia salmonis]APS60877.1 hypothetical protein AVI53_10115 [Piscirickettsia salmonis]
MTCKLSSIAEHFHDDFNHRARNIIAIGHIVAPPSSASLEKMFERELNQTNYLIVLINKRLIIQTTINYTTALLKSRAVLSEPILVGSCFRLYHGKLHIKIYDYSFKISSVRYFIG